MTSSVIDASWWPSSRARDQIVRRMTARVGAVTTAAMSRIAADHPWFSELDAQHRSWIGVVAANGINGFVEWFASGGTSQAALRVFDAAPRALTRRIALNQTVDLVRSTIDAVEAEITQMPKADQAPLQVAILHYSREVAFVAADVYAHAAESRGAWDARLEALVVDAVTRGDADQSLISRASTLGWSTPQTVTVVVGYAPEDAVGAIEAIRQAATALGIDVLAAPQGNHVVLLAGGTDLAMAGLPKIVKSLGDRFSDGPIVIGPSVDDLDQAPRSAHAALAGLQAAKAWPGVPRPVLAVDLLPERALAGDEQARREIVATIYTPLVDAGGDLVSTVTDFLDAGGSIEATARARYIHPNTVRYRLKRVTQITGHSPTDPRDAYLFRMALTLGRLLA